MPDVHPLTTYRERCTPPMTVDALARKLGVRRETVWRWESGARRPGPAILPRITRATGIAAKALRPDLANAFGED